jgi:hypothetical protein
MSPTQRSLRHLRGLGYLPWVVERRLPRTFRTVDLYNFADLVAVRADRPGVLAVQTTSASNLAARVRKVKAEPMARVWLAAGNRIACHGWKKVGRFWVADVREVSLSQMEVPM